MKCLKCGVGQRWWNERKLQEEDLCWKCIQIEKARHKIANTNMKKSFACHNAYYEKGHNDADPKELFLGRD